jgi:hypothetical protein
VSDIVPLGDEALAEEDRLRNAIAGSEGEGDQEKDAMHGSDGRRH